MANVTTAVAIAPFNLPQTVLLKNFCNGEFERMLNEKIPAGLKAKALDKCGNGLLRFLLSELADSEDCLSLDEALRRVQTAIAALEHLKAQIEIAM